MKKIFRGLAAFLLMVSIAFAASAKTVDMSKHVTVTQDGKAVLSKELSDVLIADKFMVPESDRFNTVGLSNIMYNALDEAEQATVTRVDFHILNLQANNLPAEMTVGEFRKHAGNLKLPDVQVVAKATTAPPTTLVPAAAAPQVQTPPAPVVTAENVQQQLNALSKSVDGKYGGINRRVDELQASLKKAALKSDIAKIVAETQTIINLTTRVTAVEKKVTALEKSVGVLDIKQTNLENSVGKLDAEQREIAADVTELKAEQESNGSLWLWVYGLATALILLTVAVIFVALSRAATAPVSSGSSGASLDSRIPPTFRAVA